MNYEKVKQRSEDWFRAKWGKVGGSSAKDMMGSKSTKGFKKLYYGAISSKLEEFYHEEERISAAMQRGNELERPAVEDLQLYLNIQFEEWGWLQSDIDILGISPDGMTADRKQACEVKCPSRHVHTQYIMDDRIPAEYHWQCMTYFAVIPTLEVLHFASYRPESSIPLFVKSVRRNEVVKFQANNTAQQWADKIREVAQELSESVNSAVSKLNEVQF